MSSKKAKPPTAGKRVRKPTPVPGAPELAFAAPEPAGPPPEPVETAEGPGLASFFAELAAVAEQEGQLVAALSRAQQAAQQPNAGSQRLFDCARQLRGMARASSSDDRLAAAARIVEAIWLALRREDDAALRSWLSMGSKNAPSPHRYLVETPPTAAEGWSAADQHFDRDRAARELLALAKTTLRDAEPPVKVGEIMAWGVSAWFPALCTTSELQLKKRVIAAQRIAQFALARRDAPPEEREPDSPEQLTVEALIAYGVDPSSARGWIKSAG